MEQLDMYHMLTDTKLETKTCNDAFSAAVKTAF